ncbi:MAG: MMPL domain-containing protein [Dehalococcoidales bacterium]|nr:MMPL domain-containing protein [Dehalococcoidales bacterium]
METFTRWVARKPWIVVGGWLALLIVGIILSNALLSDALITDDRVRNNPESEQASSLIKARLGESDGSPTMSEMVIVRSKTLTVDDPAFQSFIDELFVDLVALGEDVVSGGMHYYLTDDASLVSSDRHTTLIFLFMPPDALEKVDQIHEIVDSAGDLGSFEIFVAGTPTITEELFEVAERDLRTGETIGISVAMVTLVLVFGAVTAALIPIILAVIAIGVAIGATAIAGQFMELSFFVTNMITMMGLAVGIDYSLFIVARFREERTNGLEKVDAIAKAGTTAGRAVMFSGMIVVLALSGLLMFPLSTFQAMGVGAILVVITAVLASQTLLPAVMSLMGDKINAIRIPFFQYNKKSSEDSGFWVRTSKTVMRRPVVSLVVAASIILAVGIPFFDLNKGFSGMGLSELPDGLRSKEGFMVLQEEFGFIFDSPVTVAIDGKTDSESLQAAIKRLESSIASDPFFMAADLQTHQDADLSVLYTKLTSDPLSKDATDAIRRLRTDYIPLAFDGESVRVLVGGETATMVDFDETTNEYTPIVFTFVLGLSFILLTIAFRSIVVPIMSIIMNLLSVGAAYGLLVLVFQKGVGAELLGFQRTEEIITWLPLFLFAILFGLSMDYHVFLLSRIRESFKKTGNNPEAVSWGIRSTGRLITGAALIMVAVFGGFALGDMVIMQQMGFGLAVAVFMDATIIRMALVPAVMRLLGTRNWYLPKWLHWIPKVGIGE